MAEEIEILKMLDESKTDIVKYILAILGGLGGFLFGYDTGIIGDAIIFAEQTLHLTSFLIGLSVASVTLGAAIGAISSGIISDYLGRKYTLIMDALIFTIFAILLALSINDLMFVVTRTILGFAIGVDSVIGPVYIAEFAPKNTRGRLLTFQQLMIVVGIFVSYWVGYALSFSGNWRLMIGLGAIPGIIIAAFRFYMPESPRFAIIKNKVNELNQALKRFGLIVDQTAIQKVRKLQEFESQFSARDLFRKAVLPITLFAIGAALFQQFDGINVFIYYSATIFEHLGYSPTSATFTAGWVTGFGNLYPVFITQFLLVDRIGRKLSLVVSFIGMAIALLLGSWLVSLTSYIAGLSLLAATMIYLFFFEIGSGPVLWDIMPEIFPTALRGRGSSILAFFVWIGDFVVSFTFPILLYSIGISYVFLIYGIISALGILFFWFLTPETKGKSLEELSKELWYSKLRKA
ncbi:sugar porter family MFS transporter [Saccharolobus islandicus]|uniref:sugar porter family MFS transporter n=1 Tax=Saccharolobus islandicus TaxID=43080 RepID=UPI00037598A5|nr:sugar porter family MFS transporter [Sulfolobus islandicus]